MGGTGLEPWNGTKEWDSGSLLPGLCGLACAGVFLSQAAPPSGSFRRKERRTRVRWETPKCFGASFVQVGQQNGVGAVQGQRPSHEEAALDAGPRSHDALCTLYHHWWPPRREAQLCLWRAWLPLTGSGLLLPLRYHAQCYPHLCTYHQEHF